jgi:hypothetical protein
LSLSSLSLSSLSSAWLSEFESLSFLVRSMNRAIERVSRASWQGTVAIQDWKAEHGNREIESNWLTFFAPSPATDDHRHSRASFVHLPEAAVEAFVVVAALVVDLGVDSVIDLVVVLVVEAALLFFPACTVTICGYLLAQNAFAGP